MKFKNFSIAVLACIILTSPANAFPKVKTGISASKIKVPSTFFVQNGDGLSAENIEIEWWKQFNDEQLNSYIEDVSKFNYTIKSAIARIEETRAIRAGVKSNLFPQVDAKTSFSRYQIFGAEINTPNSSINAANVFSAGIDASWESDFWGKKRWDVESAAEKINATKEHKRDILVSLTAEVARNYIELRNNQEQEKILEKTILIERQTFKLTKIKYDIGLATKIDVQNAKNSLNQLQSQLPTLKSSINTGIFNISVLTGRQPSALYNELITYKPMPVAINIIATGLPVDLISRRPDIREKKQTLLAAIADVGSAKANLYPTIKLNSNFGFEKINAGNFVNFNGGLWTITPTIDWKIFDRRGLNANLNAKRASVNELANDYKQSTLNAIKEVEDTLSQLQSSKQTTDELKKATEASIETFQLTNSAYIIGLKNKTEVLCAEKNYLNNQKQYLESQTQINLETIKLYKALGGGWQ